MGWTGILRRLFAQPDEVMLETGAGGELVVARMRAWSSPLLLLLPLASQLTGGSGAETWIGVFGACVTIACSILLLHLARQRGRYRWLPFASGTFDISIITLLLALLALYDPAAGINSMVIWSFYLISIFLTALRNDGRLAAWVGVLAMLQFWALGAWILGTHQAAQLVSPGYGTANWGNVIQRLVLLAIAAIVTATIILRMQRLIDLAGTDSLTGIANRSWLGYRFPKLIARAQARGEAFAMAIIDLDHFKRINDEIGHLAGDRALCHFIGLARQGLREDDWIVRLGGEEFALVLHDELPVARARLDALRQHVAASGFDPGEGRAPCRITFSAGICTFPRDGTSAVSLLGCADKRLGIAKRTGRNRVVSDDLPVQGLDHTEATPAG